jgi:drug/metabolite transporter (DMT)-like permease
MTSNLTAGLCLLPWVASMPVELRPEQWGIVAAFGVIQLAIPYLLFAVAVRSVSAHEAALLTLIEAVLNPIWVWLFVGERASLATWIGGGCILIGLALQQYFHRRDPAALHSAIDHRPSTK